MSDYIVDLDYPMKMMLAGYDGMMKNRGEGSGPEERTPRED